MRITAMEQKPDHFRELQETVRNHLSSSTGAVDIEVLAGTLSANLARVQERSNRGPTLTFLDPFGIEGLDASTYASCLAGPKDELFVLFANVGMIRHHGVLTTDGESYFDKVDQERVQTDLFPDDQEQHIAQLEADAASRVQHLDTTAQAVRRHLTTAFGGEEWVNRIAEVASADRGEAFVRLFAERLALAGATHVLSLPMRDADGHRKYVLVHACKSAHGFVAMKEAMSQALGKDWPYAMQRRIRDELLLNIHALADQFHARNPGLSMPWSKDPLTDDETKGAKWKVLAETSLFPIQNADLKSEFKARGWLVRKDKREWLQLP